MTPESEDDFDPGESDANFDKGLFRGKYALVDMTSKPWRLFELGDCGDYLEGFEDGPNLLSEYGGDVLRGVGRTWRLISRFCGGVMPCKCCGLRAVWKMHEDSWWELPKAERVSAVIAGSVWPDAAFCNAEDSGGYFRCDLPAKHEGPHREGRIATW